MSLFPRIITKDTRKPTEAERLASWRFRYTLATHGSTR